MVHSREIERIRNQEDRLRNYDGEFGGSSVSALAGAEETFGNGFSGKHGSDFEVDVKHQRSISGNDIRSKVDRYSDLLRVQIKGHAALVYEVDRDSDNARISIVNVGDGSIINKERYVHYVSHIPSDNLVISDLNRRHYGGSK